MKRQKNPKDILIVGVGNILLGDEGVGIHVIRELANQDLPDNVEILDMGVAPFSLLPYIPGRKKVIIIDAVKAGGKVGSVYKFPADEIERRKDKFFSLHQIGIGDILAFLKPEEIPEEVVVIGIEPGEIKWGMELSPCIKDKIPQLIELILKEIPPRENQC